MRRIIAQLVNHGNFARCARIANCIWKLPRFMQFAIALLMVVLFLIGCTQTPGTKQGFVQKPSIDGTANVITDVTMTTGDNVKIKGTLYLSKGEKTVILLHMLGKNRKTWDGFAKELQGAGYTALAIDLRGHGESLEQGDSRMSYASFADKDFNDMVKDIEAARGYLNGKTVYVIGASIGANLATKYAAQDTSVQKIILLSPGIEYKGVNIEQDNMIYEGNVLIVASEDDAYSATSSKQLGEKSRGTVKLQMYENAGHGTNMLAAQPELTGFLIDWLNG